MWKKKMGWLPEQKSPGLPDPGTQVMLLVWFPLPVSSAFPSDRFILRLVPCMASSSVPPVSIATPVPKEGKDVAPCRYFAKAPRRIILAPAWVLCWSLHQILCMSMLGWCWWGGCSPLGSVEGQWQLTRKKDWEWGGACVYSHPKVGEGRWK